MPINVQDMSDDELNSILDKLRNQVPEYSRSKRPTKKRKVKTKERTITTTQLDAILAELD